MASSGGVGLGHPGPGPGGASPPRPGQPSRPAVGSKAGPHGAVIAPYGPRMPTAKPGFTTIGTGKGGWIYKPNAGAAGGAKTPTGKGTGKGGGGVKFAGPGVKLNDPILDPSKPLSGQSLYNAAKALADAQTKGPEAELANQIAQNNRQMTGAINQAGGYFNSLGNFAKQGVTSEQNIAQGLNTGLGLIGGGQQAALQGIGQNAQSALQKYTPGDPSTSAPAMQALTAELARQQALGAQETTAFKTAGALQGANYGGLAASALGSDALAGTQALKGIAQSGEVKNEPLNAKIAALRAQSGALLGTDLGKLRQQEIANQFTSKGLGLKQQSLKLTAANDLAKNNLTLTKLQNAQMNSDRTFNLNKAKFGLAQATADYERTHGLGPYRPSKASSGSGGSRSGGAYSPAENAKVLGQINHAVGLIRSAQASFGTKNQVAPRGQVRTALAARTGYPNYILDAAFELVGYGALSPSTAAQLHHLGLRGGGYKVGANDHGAGARNAVANAVGNLV